MAESEYPLRDIHLPDGQVLRAQVLEETDEQLVIRHDLLGELTIDRVENDVAVLPLEGPVEMAAGEPPVLEGLLEEDAVESEGLMRNVEGELSFGYTLQSGRTDRDEVSFRAQLMQTLGRSEYRFIGDFLYGKQEREKNADHYGLSLRWRRELDRRFFSQVSTSYEKDRIREIRHRVEQDFGIGYRFIDRPGFRASIGPGFTIQYDERYPEEPEEGVGLTDEDKWNYLATVFQDVRWQMNDRYRLEQDSKVLFDPSDTGEYQYRANLGLVGKITDSISLSVRYGLTYENRTPADVASTEQRLVTALGYLF